VPLTNLETKQIERVSLGGAGPESGEGELLAKRFCEARRRAMQKGVGPGSGSTRILEP